jgi:hypothetical protein
LVFQVDDHNIISDGMLKMFCMENVNKAYEIIDDMMPFACCCLRIIYLGFPRFFVSNSSGLPPYLNVMPTK